MPKATHTRSLNGSLTRLQKVVLFGVFFLYNRVLWTGDHQTASEAGFGGIDLGLPSARAQCFADPFMNPKPIYSEIQGAGKVAGHSN